MSQQEPVSVFAPIIPGKLADLEKAVGVVDKKADPANPNVIYWKHDPAIQVRFRDFFGQLNEVDPHVHFARWFILYAQEDKSDDGMNSPGELIYLAAVDGTGTHHIGHLSRFQRSPRDHRMPLLDGLYQFCMGFPNNADSSQVTTYFERHSATPKAFYVNKPGRTVSQVWKDAALRKTLIQFIDKQDWTGKTPENVRADIQLHAQTVLDLQPGPRPDLLRRVFSLVGGVLKRIGIATVDGISRLSPLLTPKNQGSDEVGELTPEELEQLEHLDDHGAVQSPFFVDGRIKRGGCRRWLTIILYRITDIAGRLLYDDGSLAGLKTIHSARWLVMENSHRGFFASTYDGSMENYNSDFVDIVPAGLNLTFGTIEGYPKTKFLIGGGANHEFEFRRVLHNHQATASMWYSAYPEFTAFNLANNAAIRTDLFKALSSSETEAWLQRF